MLKSITWARLRQGCTVVFAGMAAFGLTMEAASARAMSDPSALRQTYVEAYAKIDPGMAGPRQSDYVYDLIMEKGGSNVPVLMPYEMTDCAESAAYHRLGLRVAPSSYTGILHQAGLEIVITGQAASQYAGAISPNYYNGWHAFDDNRGGTVRFGFAGANYEIQFHCRGLKEPGHGNCMTAEKAEGFVKDMLAGN
ncbi:MAG: hypothetical protein EP340_01345 [Alphaproteobacteria bacterium]|nr:MAG: hypothetical protein EP340_01345 [Alphaproteobacteria bacterium]